MTPPSQRLNQPVDPWLERVILACLAKRPAERPQSTREIVELLERSPLAGAWTRDDADAFWAAHRGRIDDIVARRGQRTSEGAAWYINGVAFPPMPEPFRGRAVELRTLVAACGSGESAARAGGRGRQRQVDAGGRPRPSRARPLSRAASSGSASARWDHRTLLDMLAIRLRVPLGG